jgi:hypothetical protein
LKLTLKGALESNTPEGELPLKLIMVTRYVPFVASSSTGLKKGIPTELSLQSSEFPALGKSQ